MQQQKIPMNNTGNNQWQGPKRKPAVIRKVLQNGLTDEALDKQIKTLSLAAGTTALTWPVRRGHACSAIAKNGI